MASVLYGIILRVCMCVCAHLGLKIGCINVNPPLDFIDSIRGMRLWASKMARVREAGGERERAEVRESGVVLVTWQRARVGDG